MNPLLIEPTFTTPEVKFLISGKLYIGGRCLPEDSVKFFRPIFEWLTNFRGTSITIDIRLEYLNTSSSKQMLTLLNYIKDNPNVKNALVNWYYEEGDDEYYENGRELESITQLDFEFHEYAETD